MFKEFKDRACIVGIGETSFCRKPGSGLSELGIQLKASIAALEDAGLAAKQIDGIMPFPTLGKAETLAASLGCSNLRFAATLHMGGASPVGSLRTAAMAVTMGAADYVLVPGGWNGYSGAALLMRRADSIPGGSITATSICRSA